MAGPGAISYHSSIKRRASGSTLWTILCACTLLGTATEGIVNLDRGIVNSTNDEGMIAYAKPFITAENSQFGAKIEGTSVDSFGRVYAVDFQDQKSQLGQLSDAFGGEEQRLFFKQPDENSQFNGIRFFPVPLKNSELASAALVADKKGQVLQVLQNKAGVVRARVFCKDETMMELKDLAVAYKSGRLYSTGLNYAPTTTHRDGNLWLCKTPQNETIFSSNVGESGTVAEAVRLNVQGRANGIEISWDEVHLYASETWANDMKVYSNVVWKYDIDAATGKLSNKNLFFDMKEIDEELRGEGGDIDGVRTDMAGNLYIVRNGELGEVVKVSAEGKIVKRIKLEGVTEPTNIEFAGPHGTVLFIVGKCKTNLQKGCVDVWENDDAPGRAFFNLWRPVLQPFALVSQYNPQSSTKKTNQVPPVPQSSPPISYHNNQSSTNNRDGVRQRSTDNPSEVRQSSTNNVTEDRQSYTNNPHELRPVSQRSPPVSQFDQSSTNYPEEIGPVSQRSPPVSQFDQSSTNNPEEIEPVSQRSPPISQFNQSSTNNPKEIGPVSQRSLPISQFNRSSTNNPKEIGPVSQRSPPTS